MLQKSTKTVGKEKESYIFLGICVWDLQQGLPFPLQPRGTSIRPHRSQTIRLQVLWQIFSTKRLRCFRKNILKFSNFIMFVLFVYTSRCNICKWTNKWKMILFMESWLCLVFIDSIVVLIILVIALKFSVIPFYNLKYMYVVSMTRDMILMNSHIVLITSVILITSVLWIIRCFILLPQSVVFMITSVMITLAALHELFFKSLSYLSQTVKHVLLRNMSENVISCMYYDRINSTLVVEK